MAYIPLYPVGARVRIASADVLVRFMRPAYKFHDPVTDKHLSHAGESHTVVSVGMYHGGDQLYVLDGVPKTVWLEVCLIAPPPA